MRVISRTTWRVDMGSCSTSMERSMRCDDACVLLPLLSTVPRLSAFFLLVAIYFMIFHDPCYWSTILCHWFHNLSCTLRCILRTLVKEVLSLLQHCYTPKLSHHNIQQHRANGWITSPMGLGPWLMLMVTNMLARGRTARRASLGSCITPMVINSGDRLEYCIAWFSAT